MLKTMESKSVELFLSGQRCHQLTGSQWTESEKVLVDQLCSTLCDPMDCSLPSSSAHGILQASILEWVTHSLLQGIFPTHGSNPGLPHCRRILLSAEPPLEGADAEVEAPKLWPPDVKS